MLGEMHMILRPARQPCPDRRRFMGSVVVHDNVNVEVVGHLRHHRQNWLFAIEGLDLALLIDTEHKRPVGRRQIEADNIADLVDE